MKLPEQYNKHIKQRMSINEIADSINKGQYSAELLLQHLVLNYNALVDDRERLLKELKSYKQS